jgi:opacity protein-like surface antigen
MLPLYKEITMRKFFTIILIAWSALVYAGDPSRKGTTGAEELLIPVGARSIATGGAFLSNISGLEAIYYNPAGLAQGKGTEAMFSFMTYLADIKVSYFAIGTNLGDLGSVALSVKSLGFGNIAVTTDDAPDGNGSTFSPGYLTAGFSYAKVITDRVCVGVNAKVINETIADVSATGFALDFGVQYKFPSNLSIGAAVKNIGTNMSFSGNSLQSFTNVPGSQTGSPVGNYQVVTEEFQIPSYFELCMAYNYNINEHNIFTLGASFRNNNSFEDELRLGLEYGFNNQFFLRGGYCTPVQNISSTSTGANYGFTAGAGINYSFIDGMDFILDYAFQQVKEFPNPNHTFTIKLNIL